MPPPAPIPPQPGQTAHHPKHQRGIEQGRGPPAGSPTSSRITSACWWRFRPLSCHRGHGARGRCCSGGRLGGAVTNLPQDVQGLLEVVQGNVVVAALALDYYQQALTIEKESGDCVGQAVPLSNVGLIPRITGRLRHGSGVSPACPDDPTADRWPSG